MLRTPLAALLLCGAAALAARPDPTPEQAMLAAAQAVLATLDEEQTAQLGFPFEGEERERWHFVPRERLGLHLGEMGDATRVALHRLLQTAMSSRGYLKVQGVWMLEEVLYEAERARGRDGAMRDPGNYVLQFHGLPGATEPWGWRVEGHHVSINYTWVPGQPLSPAPFFLGASPHEVRAGERAGLRPLGAEEDLAWRLMDSFDEGQRARVVIEGKKPRDVIFGPDRTGDLDVREGLPRSEMTGPQQALLSDLVGEYLSNLDPVLHAREAERMAAADRGAIHFAWAGDLRPGGDFYYRVHGPHFAIEFATQGGPQHVHTVYRDLEDDFGREILRRHYQRDHGDG